MEAMATRMRSLGPLSVEDDDERANETAADVVMGILAVEPGLRGHEIAERAASRVPPVKERTVRTALFRLKNKFLLKILDDRWYLAKDAPADPVDRMREG